MARHPPGTFSPDGRLIAVGLNERGDRLLDSRTLDQVGVPLLETGGEVIELTFSPDGRTLAASHRTRQMTVWDMESRSLRWRRAGSP